ncbi:MAG: DUF1257 domain-containing protein [Planctomycetes bacterium]|nr:DUF1257 domain-containing protein [Planctomycetota bacterium]
MSHVVHVQTEIRDVQALRAACQRLHLKTPVLETVELFSGQATGYTVQLRDWRYPAVCKVETGTVQFDNYGGRWGQQRELDRLLQAYAVEKTRIEAHQQGHTVSEQSLADGSFKLTIHMGETV